jgi:SAM-dependent methyltransferase
MKRLAKELAKLTLNVGQSGLASIASKVGLIDFPVPPNWAMRKTSSKTISHYYISGIRCYLPIATMALHYGVKLDSEICILDFGCGVARELMHFQRFYPHPRYFACDINPANLDFVGRHFSVECYKNEFKPPLRYETSSMDMIYSVSTFSHLHPSDHLPWLRELCRVTKTGQFCFVTTEGPTGFPKVKLEASLQPSDEGQFHETGILYKEYSILDASMGVTGSYGNTILAPEHIRKAWPDSGFEVLDIVEGIIDHRQDLVVLRKPYGS